MTTTNDEALTTKEHTEAHGDKIKGYRKLSDEEVDLINQVKPTGEYLRNLIDTVSIACPLPDVDSATIEDYERYEETKIWIDKAEDAMKCGVMFLTRAIAKPSGF